MVGDLIEPGEVTFTIQFVPTTAPPVVGSTGTLTLTDAVASGDSTACNWSGTAIITEVNHGSRVKNQLNTMTVTVKWDGGTGPTFTAAT